MFMTLHVCCMFNRFSIVRESNGTISTVYYPSGEPETVLAFKKTLAGLFSVDVVSSDRSAAGDRAVLVHEELNHGSQTNCQSTC